MRALVWLLPFAWLALGACSDTHSAGFGSESNWLRACHKDAQCGAGACVCGVCSADCAKDSDCPTGLRCQRRDSALYVQACGDTSPVRGLCAPSCTRNADCGAQQSCREQVCTLPVTRRLTEGGVSDAFVPSSDAGRTDDAFVPSNDGGGDGISPSAPEPDGGGPLMGARQLVVDANLALNAACVPDLEKTLGSGAGMFDIGGSLSSGGDCSRPYMLALRVQNLASQNVLITKARVLLMDRDQNTIGFNRANPPPPNPFNLSVTGSVPATSDAQAGIAAILTEVIPREYARQLDSFAGKELSIRVELQGETLDGVQLLSNAFVYRVSVCNHCLLHCISDLQSTGHTVEELVAGMCDDRAAADGRYCFDSSC
jgi:hypothetical protein